MDDHVVSASHGTDSSDGDHVPTAQMHFQNSASAMY